MLERLVMLKRVITVCTVAVLGLGIVLLTLNSLQWVVPGIFAGGAQVNAAPRVIPGLREWHGGTGSFAMRASSHIAVDPSSGAQLQRTAQALQSDLAGVTGHTLPIITTDAAGPGDVYLTLHSADSAIGDEGYLFTVADWVVISARTTRGVLYGTRTALQILAQDPTHAHIPRGFARDYPKYRERGFMLDAGRKFFSIGALKDYVKLMAWYKLNDFHLHLNDNAFGAGDSADWMHQYAAFRLNSDRFPGLAAKDGSYSRQDIRGLQDLAQQYAVTITPEIDAPAHALAFTQYRPDLASPSYSKDLLDLRNPDTYTFMNAIWDEFLPWFDTSQVHIGADEYARGDADNYRRFINYYDAYLKRKGKSVRMWGSLSVMQSGITVANDVVTDLWNNGWANPVDTVRQGFDVINANDDLLYIVPRAGTYHDYLDTRQLYDHWAPNIFDLSNPGLNLRPDEPHLLGSMFSVWNDRLGSVVSDADVADRVRAALPTLSQKMWGSASASTSYDEFAQLARQIGGPPGTPLPQTPALAAAPDGVALAAAPQTLARQTPGVPPGPPPARMDWALCTPCTAARGRDHG
ncbi:MAG: hypothetical protein PVSMB4_03580 [Ktedonobacterales bacterium]